MISIHFPAFFPERRHVIPYMTAMSTEKGFIPENVIEDIRGRTDIVEIVSDYVSLKKSGANFKGLCPFHQEKSPSFNVNQEKQFYHCFGCGESGNVFRFLMKMENLAFPESVRLLAARYGVSIPDAKRRKDGQRDEREILLDLNGLAASFFENQLRSPEGGRKAREYLEERGVSMDVAKRFAIGFAPDAWDSCLVYLANKGFSVPQLERAGLIKANEARSRFFDRFRNRIIFPFHDTRGRVVGFGGRLFGGGEEKGPKYLNSPETDTFKKGKIFYGIHHAVKGIQQKGFAVIVEGYFDALTAYLHGFDNVVANSGTALTEDHASLLSRYAKNVTMVYDSDTAGASASERAFEILLKKGFHARMVVLPPGEDPDSYLKKYGPEKFSGALKDAKPFIESLIQSAAEEATSETSVEGKMRRLEKILPFIEKIPSTIEKNEYINILSERLGIPERAIYSDLKKTSRGHPTTSRMPATGLPPRQRPTLSEQCERGIIQLMLQKPDFIDRVEETVSCKDFKNPDFSAIASVLFARNKEGTNITIDKIMESLPEEGQRSLAGALAMEALEFEDPDRALCDFARGMKKEEKRQKLREIQQKKSDAAKSLKVEEFEKLKENCAVLRQDLN